MKKSSLGGSQGNAYIVLICSAAANDQLSTLLQPQLNVLHRLVSLLLVNHATDVRLQSIMQQVETGQLNEHPSPRQALSATGELCKQAPVPVKHAHTYIVICGMAHFQQLGQLHHPCHKRIVDNFFHEHTCTVGADLWQPVTVVIT